MSETEESNEAMEITDDESNKPCDSQGSTLEENESDDSSFVCDSDAYSTSNEDEGSDMEIPQKYNIKRQKRNKQSVRPTKRQKSS